MPPLSSLVHRLTWPLIKARSFQGAPPHRPKLVNLQYTQREAWGPVSSSLLPPPGVQLVDWACPLTSGPKLSIEMVIRGPAFLPGAIPSLPETGSLPTPSLWSNVYINKDVASTTAYQDAPVPLPLGLSPHSPSASHRRVTFFRGQSSPHPSHRPSNQWPGPSIPQHINLHLSAADV